MLATAGGLLLAAKAHAAPCGKPVLLYALPPDGADNVPTDATLSAIYAKTAHHGNEPVTLKQSDGTEVPAQVNFDDNELTLTLKPDAPLTAGEVYTVEWPAQLRGYTTTNDKPKDVTFTVGSGPDSAAPSFDGVTSVSWDVKRSRDSCTNSVEERFVFDLDLAQADDDGGRDSLELLLFKTVGSGAPLQEPVRAMPSGNKVSVASSVGAATGHVCFAALARDLTGKTSASGDHTVCVDTVKPPFFYGCRVAGGREAGKAGWLGLALAAFAFAWRRVQ